VEENLKRARLCSKHLNRIFLVLKDQFNKVLVGIALVFLNSENITKIIPVLLQKLKKLLSGPSFPVQPSMTNFFSTIIQPYDILLKESNITSPLGKNFSIPLQTIKSSNNFHFLLGIFVLFSLNNISYVEDNVVLDVLNDLNTFLLTLIDRSSKRIENVDLIFLHHSLYLMHSITTTKEKRKPDCVNKISQVYFHLLLSTKLFI
jgi:hypothetical protein